MTDKDKKSQPIKTSDPEGPALWKQVIADVTPLKGKASETLPEVSQKKRKARDRENEKEVFPPVSKGDIRRGAGRHEVDARTLDRLKRGQMAIEARLDLHGMSRVQAHAALERFILACVAEGRRCVLVITGKGAPRSSEAQGGGILKQSVPEWLREGALHDVVLRAVPARPKDGGAGALYVLLRRKR